jgi:hypothetical protein
MIAKIISGGQTGADRAGLIAAKQAGIPTGGWMPKGFKALDGYHPHFATLYNIKEHSSPAYSPRTFANVHESDGTVRFAADFSTSGEICTLNAIRKLTKIHFNVAILGTVQPIELAHWIIDNNISILNVAGNSEKTCKGIGEFVVAFLLETFTILTISQTVPHSSKET